jgi:hypothetical protein
LPPHAASDSATATRMNGSNRVGMPQECSQLGECRLNNGAPVPRSTWATSVTEGQRAPPPRLAPAGGGGAVRPLDLELAEPVPRELVGYE